uniref:Uncharacterized protein n=1 Tax=Arion vulgaris TaxID=1028688 RepID=A0A0B7APE6_9EUPU
MNPIVEASITSLISNTHISTAVSLHSNDQAPLPEWCFHNEDQLPAVYKQVFEACIVIITTQSHLIFFTDVQ